jgi:menaquinone-dependent protoporphyrinogen oxidase
MRHQLSKHDVPVLSFDLATEKPEPFLLEEAHVIFAIAPIRYGFHLPAVTRYLRDHKKIIDKRPLVMASINLTARKPEKKEPLTNPYFKKWIKRNKLSPVLGAVFGGELDYAKYPLWDRLAIRLIMTITRGPTDMKSKIDYTDWDRVTTFAGDIATLYRHLERQAA